MNFCEVTAVGAGTLILRKRWRFVARDQAGNTVAQSDIFTSSTHQPALMDLEQRIHRELCHRLTLDGWKMEGDPSHTRGRHWWSYRFYREEAET
jgi:hypothetical protein